jgi:hypothetical protein
VVVARPSNDSGSSAQPDARTGGGYSRLAAQRSQLRGVWPGQCRRESDIGTVSASDRNAWSPCYGGRSSGARREAGAERADRAAPELPPAQGRPAEGVAACLWPQRHAESEDDPFNA